MYRCICGRTLCVTIYVYSVKCRFIDYVELQICFVILTSIEAYIF